MQVKKAVGNMYTFVTHVWSPAIGCEHGCTYCSTRSFMFQPTMVRRQPGELPYLGDHRIIFVCHLCDLFSEHAPADLVVEVLRHCKAFRYNTYVFQSKNPKRFREFEEHFPDRFMLGTTIETDRQDLAGRYATAPPVLSRAYGLADAKAPRKFVSIEPVMDFDLEGLVALVETAAPNFVSIGGDSKRHFLPEPSQGKVAALIAELRKRKIEVILKSNLERLMV